MRRTPGGADQPATSEARRRGHRTAARARRRDSTRRRTRAVARRGSSTPPASSSTRISAARRSLGAPRHASPSSRLRLHEPRIRPRHGRHAAGATRTPSGCSAGSPAPRPRSSSTTTPRRRCSSLAALAAGREVIISRGELVEIGGGFRVPDVMAQSGAIAARGRHDQPDAGGRLRGGHRRPNGAHPPRAPVELPIEGFTERPSRRRARRRSDAASTSRSSRISAADSSAPARRSTRSGTNPRSPPASRPASTLVMFSGDKLLGGPQAGIIAGPHGAVARVRTHPLMRALRVDKLTYAALEATLEEYAAGRAADAIPVVRAIALSADAIGRRAEAWRHSSPQLASARTSSTASRPSAAAAPPGRGCRRGSWRLRFPPPASRPRCARSARPSSPESRTSASFSTCAPSRRRRTTGLPRWSFRRRRVCFRNCPLPTRRLLPRAN